MKYKKLPKRLKDKWVKALLSGKYKQRKGVLVLNGEYCCLGVLGVACGISVAEMSDRNNLSDVNRDDIIGDDSDHSLQNKLIHMNDGQNRSFKWIAAYVKRYL